MSNRVPQLLLWLVLALAGCPLLGEAPTPPPDIARITARGELRVALHKDDAPPFFFRGPDGRLDGLDVALARDIAARLGVELRFVRDAETYDALVDRVASGEADVAISLLSRTLPRALRVRFTRPYAQLHQALLINRLSTARLKLNPDPAKALNRAEVRIATIAGSAYLEFARQGFPLAGVVAYPDWDSAVAGLLKGEAHALLWDDIEILNWLRRHPERSLDVGSAVLDDHQDSIAMAVNWRDTHWLSWLDLYLETLVDSGALERLQRRYFEEEAWRSRH